MTGNAAATLRVSRSVSMKNLVLMLMGCLLVAAGAWAMVPGTVEIPVATVVRAFVAFDGSREHMVVTVIRLPRVLAAILAGSALAVSGAIMQAVTGNPLASPGLLGVNAGAAFAVVLAMTVSGVGFDNAYVWYAFGGATVAALTVFSLGSVGGRGATPLKLVLAGAVVATFLTSLTTAMLIFDQTTLDAVRLWTAGSLSERTMEHVRAIAPYILAGLCAAILFGRHLTTLALGEAVARSIGQNTLVWRGLAILVVIMLAGGAVALAGPIGFVGLVVPHAVRLIAGHDYRWIIPFSALGGALLLVIADVAGRTFFAIQNFPVGVTMALIGAPVFIWLARYRIGNAS